VRDAAARIQALRAACRLACFVLFLTRHPLRVNRIHEEHFMTATTDTDPRSVADLLHELAGESKTLVQHEVELLRAELSSTAETAKVAAVETVSGLALMFSGVLLLLLGAAFGLGESMPLWLATLIVGVIAGAGGALLLRAGVPEHKGGQSETVKSLRESAHAIKEQLT
jgi:hypothetical protein